jgi:hypothetical protein
MAAVDMTPEASEQFNRLPKDIRERMRFKVKGDAILIDKIGHRRDFYDD